MVRDTLADGEQTSSLAIILITISPSPVLSIEPLNEVLQIIVEKCLKPLIEMISWNALMAAFLFIPGKAGGTPRSFSSRNATELLNVNIDYLFTELLPMYPLVWK